MASNSLVNKNLQEHYGEGVFAGIPVTLVAKNRYRIFDISTENRIDQYFDKESNEYSVVLDDLKY